MMKLPIDGARVQKVRETDISAVARLEREGYPLDEAASEEKLLHRHSQAPELFLGCYLRDTVIGYICSTRANDDTLTEESMSTHVPSGESVCIHSVCIDSSYRRQGMALALLKAYVEHIGQNCSGVKRLLLLTHTELLHLYTKAGFRLVGESAVTHGARPWYECVLKLETTCEGDNMESMNAM
ncbi:PREDICTED: uncharacterized N-acetyltransferase C9.02c-like [Priapulus caudatus]|uniref:Serotonin N-acetyltransferase n=1 Tax=Priapulus caudatus TaxID=37621 RepID=A0ABM1EIZ4_PRICU|nr:PREDICTED: uncharacterized N-acetyltransferase C9.02c-like [Priapulus caudatus]